MPSDSPPPLPYQRRQHPRYPGIAEEGGWRRYLPGEDVLCPAHDSHRKAGVSTECLAFIVAVGPDTVVRIRQVNVRAFDERRRTLRGQTICPRCPARLELEWLPFEPQREAS